MNKTSRLALLKSRYAAKFGTAIPGLIAPSQVEISKVAKAVSRATKTDDSISSGDENTVDEIHSRLVFDKVSPRDERETDILLTAKEKRILSQDLLRAGVTKAAPTIEVEIVAVEIFPDNPDAEYIPMLEKRFDVENAGLIAAWTIFELAVLADLEMPKLCG